MEFVVGLSPFLNERTSNLLIFLNVGSIIPCKLMIFGSVLISDLNFFQETVPLNPCFKGSKNLMLSFIDKVTTRT